MNEDYKTLVNYVIRNVPPDIRQDCFQAAWIGLMHAQKRQESLLDPAQESIHTFSAYAIECMKNEVLKEIALLKGPGHGGFSMDKKTFLLFGKYKKAVSDGSEVDSLKMSNSRKRAFAKIMKSKRLYNYFKTSRDDTD